MKKIKKSKQQPASVVTGFGHVHKTNPLRSVNAYVIMAVALMMICATLIWVIMTHVKEPIPAKVAVFDKDETDLEGSVFSKGGFLDQTMSEVGSAGSVDEAVDKTVGKIKQAAAARTEGIVERMTNQALDKAVDTARKVASATDDPEALLSAGTSYLKNGRYQEALDIFNRLVSLNGQNSLYIVQRGAARVGLGEILKGAEDIERAAAMDPRFAQIAHQAKMLKNLYINTGWRPAVTSVASVATSLSKEDKERITRQVMSPDNPTR